MASMLGEACIRPTSSAGKTVSSGSALFHGARRHDTLAVFRGGGSWQLVEITTQL